jgi:hypothetical protein
MGGMGNLRGYHKNRKCSEGSVLLRQLNRKPLRLLPRKPLRKLFRLDRTSDLGGNEIIAEVVHAVVYEIEVEVVYD